MNSRFARMVWDSIRPEEGVKRRMGFRLSHPLDGSSYVVVQTNVSPDGDRITDILRANDCCEEEGNHGRFHHYGEGQEHRLPLSIHGCSSPIRALQHLGYKVNEHPFSTDAPYPQPTIGELRRPRFDPRHDEPEEEEVFIHVNDLNPDMGNIVPWRVWSTTQPQITPTNNYEVTVDYART